MPRSVETVVVSAAYRDDPDAPRIFRWGQRGSRPKAFLQLTGESDRLLTLLTTALDEADDVCALAGEVVVLQCAALERHDPEVVDRLMRSLDAWADSALAAQPAVVVESAAERRCRASLGNSRVAESDAATEQAAFTAMQLRLALDADLVVDVVIASAPRFSADEARHEPTAHSTCEADQSIAGQAERLWRGVARYTQANAGASRRFHIMRIRAAHDEAVAETSASLIRMISAAGVARPQCDA